MGFTERPDDDLQEAADLGIKAAQAYLEHAGYEPGLTLVLLNAVKDGQRVGTCGMEGIESNDDLVETLLSLLHAVSGEDGWSIQILRVGSDG